MLDDCNLSANCKRSLQLRYHNIRDNSSGGRRDNNSRGKHCTYTGAGATAPTASRVNNIIVAEATSDNVMNADATEVETYVTRAAEVSSVLTLVQAAAAAAA